MDLEVTVSASPFDEHYEMALVYCFDRAKNYCFSLSRFPSEPLIEVMVLDQVNHKVEDLDVCLTQDVLVASFSPETAAQLDGESQYNIRLTGVDAASLKTVREALLEIFRDKQGLRIVD
ncbi:transcriptional repressor [Roseateles sp.]|uniref:transcriptional repressor n=1 Tax=Roseateles sp. TaxID=1971397 RepID=UPI002F3F1EBE